MNSNTVGLLADTPASDFLTSPILPHYRLILPPQVRDSLNPSCVLAASPHGHLIAIPGRLHHELRTWDDCASWRGQAIRFPELLWVTRGALVLPARHIDLGEFLPGDTAAFRPCGPAWLIGHAEQAEEEVEYRLAQCREAQLVAEARGASPLRRRRVPAVLGIWDFAP